MLHLLFLFPYGAATLYLFFRVQLQICQVCTQSGATHIVAGACSALHCIPTRDIKLQRFIETRAYVVICLVG